MSARAFRMDGSLSGVPSPLQRACPAGPCGDHRKKQALHGRSYRFRRACRPAAGRQSRSSATVDALRSTIYWSTVGPDSPRYGDAQTSAASHAQPRPLWHCFLRLMHVLPQACPSSQTLQHFSAGMHAAAACGDSRSAATAPVGATSATHAKRPTSDARTKCPIVTSCHAPAAGACGMTDRYDSIASRSPRSV